MPSALIEVLSDYTHADTAVPKLQRESQIDGGTRAAFDFLDPYTYGASAVPASIAASGHLLNLVDGGADAVNNSVALNTGAAGIVLTGLANEFVILPDSCKMAADATKFGFGGWIKSADITGAAGPYTSLAGFSTNTAPANCQWVVQRLRDSVQTVYAGQVSGRDGAAITVANGEVAHVFWVATITAGVLVLTGYKNGVLVHTSANYTLSGGVLPVPASTPRIGMAGGFNCSTKCSVGQFDVVDFSVAGSQTVAQYLAAAYGDNVGRFT